MGSIAYPYHGGTFRPSKGRVPQLRGTAIGNAIAEQMLAEYSSAPEPTHESQQRRDDADIDAGLAEWETLDAGSERQMRAHALRMHERHGHTMRVVERTPTGLARIPTIEYS